jgi:PAS domain S-box-containing protein
MRWAPDRLRVLAWLTLLLIPVWPAVASAQDQSSRPKGILVLYYYGKDYPANVEFEEGVLAALKTARPGAFEYYPEYLEPNRFPGKLQSEAFQDYLRKKYADHRIDVIIAQTDIALSFLLQSRKDLFPTTPIVFFARKLPELSSQPGEPGYSGVVADHAYQQTLELALSLHPSTKRVYVVTRTAENDPTLATIVHEQLRPFANRLEVTYLTNLPLEEMLSQVRNASEESIILYVRYSQDEPGKTLGPREILALVAQSSKVPIYGIAEGFVGHGIVGGYVFRQQEAGKRLAEMALSISSGTRTSDLPIETARIVPMFDWRQLERWDLDERRLPAGSLVRFREPTFWELYKWRIIGVISLIILEALLIVWLLISGARRREAERESERLARVAEAERRRLDEVVSNVPGIVWETRLEPDHKTRKTHFVSDHVQQMLGYSVDEWLTTPNFALNIMVEEDRERLARATEAILESGKEGVAQFRWRAKDGRILWVETQMAAVRDETDQPIGLRGVTIDITDRKKAEEALSESEERYRNVVETQTELICRYLPDTTLTFVNDAYSRFFGKTRDQLIGTKFIQLLPEHARDAALSHVASLIDTPSAETYEHEVILPNGKPGWQQWIDHVVAANGHGVELQGIGRDITERRRAEEALLVSETRFRTMADCAPLLIWMCGPDGLCTYLNQGWLDFTGETIEHELGTGWTDGIFHEDYVRCMEIFQTAFDRREPLKMEYRLRRADGVFCWVYDSGTPRFSLEGEFLGYIGSCIDIADRKEAEVALQSAHEEVSKLKNQLEAENVYLQEEIKLTHNVNEIIGESDAIKYVLFKIEQVSQTDTTVLILGETGTGKELVARAIHNQSGRKDRPLVKVNCAALSASLIESELFGHEKGAFTGASARKIGRFELADGATIFLDEIGELPLELQSKLLRVVQEGELERLGSTKTIKVDVRILAATNRNLKDEVDKGAFRQDLWYRLNVFPVTVPPLRQRKDDIPLMVDHFVTRCSRKIGKTITSISSGTLRKLNDYSWPGNVRELANIIERAVVNAHGPVLHIVDQFEQLRPEKDSAPERTLEEVEREHILRTLDSTSWRIEGSAGAARILGLNPSTLRTRMVKLGIQKSLRTSGGRTQD